MPMSRFELYSPRYPLLPLKNVVIFPRNIVTLLVGRSRSIQAVEEALTRDRQLVVTAHRDGQLEDPKPDDLYEVGTLARINEIERPESGQIQVVLEGVSRVKIAQFDSTRPFYTVSVDERVDGDFDEMEASAFVRHVQDLAAKYSETSGRLTADVLEMANKATEPGHLADLLATQLLSEATALGRRQRLLEEQAPLKRLEEIAVHLSSETENALLEQKIKTRVREQIDKNQREYFLREQLKRHPRRVRRRETATRSRRSAPASRTRLPRRGAPRSCSRKLGRLERMPPVSAEATVVRTYLETLLALPWHERTDDCLDLGTAEEILNNDHFGLENVKERILDYLAVRKLTVSAGQADAVQILCLAGPPGVGKTSLGRSIATAMGRNFVRVSLGGVRDEADIRGHRRTYIGAMPGRIVGAMKSAGTINPLILLDEIDKLAADYRGDPAAAMLEVLDPEQNQHVHRPFPRCSVRPLDGAVHHHGQQRPSDPAAAAGPDGDHRGLRLHRGREDRDRQTLPAAQTAQSARP